MAAAETGANAGTWLPEWSAEISRSNESYRSDPDKCSKSQVDALFESVRPFFKEESLPLNHKSNKAFPLRIQLVDALTITRKIKEGHGFMFCNPPGTGKTATTWMALTHLACGEDPHFTLEEPVLILVNGNEGGVKELWYDQYDMFEGEEEKGGQGALDIAWIAEAKELDPSNDAYIDHADKKLHHVYLVSTHLFNKGDPRLKDFIARKKFKLAIVDEAHGCGTARSQFPSKQNEYMVQLLGKVQRMLITATPGWGRPGPGDVRSRYTTALGQCPPHHC